MTDTDNQARGRQWLTHFIEASGKLLPIVPPGTNYPPPTGWNSKDFQGFLSVDDALKRLQGGRNVATWLNDGMFILDADNPAAVERIEQCLNGKKTLSVDTPRGRQWIFMHDPDKRIGQKTYSCGIDTRGGGRGYGMAPGSQRDAASYKDGKCPDGDAPWRYRIHDLEPVWSAPDSIMELIDELEADAKAERVIANEAKAKRRIEKQDKQEWEVSQLGEILKYVDPDAGESEWIKILMGCKEQFGEEARTEVEAWSQCSDKYDPQEFDSHWSSIKPGGGITFGSVVMEAKSGGWTPPKKASRRGSSLADIPMNRGKGGKPAAILARYGLSDVAMGTRVAQRFGKRLMVAKPEPGASGDKIYHRPYALASDGIWQDDAKPFQMMQNLVVRSLYEQAESDSSLFGEAKSKVMSAIDRSNGDAKVKNMRKFIEVGRHVAVGSSEPGTAGEIIVAEGEELDQKSRYLGTASGVVDLETMQLLSADDAREHKVTVRSPTKYVPSATHRIIDTLFDHLPTGVGEYFWNVIGYHLRFGPSRRYYGLIGPKGGGKSVLGHLLRATFGAYCETVPDDQLDLARNRGSGGIDPATIKFMQPTRFVVLSDASAKPKDHLAIKRYSGGDRISGRNPWDPQLKSRPATATLMIIANPEAVPLFRLSDDAMADRYREIPYESVPDSVKDASVERRARNGDPALTEPFLAKAVRYAQKQVEGKLPIEPEAVKSATSERQKSDSGDIGVFAKRIVPSPGMKLAFKNVWQAWCESNGDVHKDWDERGDIMPSESGGFRKRWFTKTLAEHVTGLGSASTIRFGSHTEKGWENWELLDEIPDDEPDDEPDGDDDDAAREALYEEMRQAGVLKEKPSNKLGRARQNGHAAPVESGKPDRRFKYMSMNDLGAILKELSENGECGHPNEDRMLTEHEKKLMWAEVEHQNYVWHADTRELTVF